MKKNFRFLIPLLLLVAAFFASCDKDAHTTTDFDNAVTMDADGYEIEEDFDDYVADLDDRAASIAKFSRVGSGNTVVASHNLPSKYLGRMIVDQGEIIGEVKFEGTEFPLTYEVVSPNPSLIPQVMSVKFLAKQTGKAAFLTDTLNGAGDFSAFSGGTTFTETLDAVWKKGKVSEQDSLGTFNITAIVKIPVVSKKDSTISFVYKKRTMPAIGRKNGSIYGTLEYDFAMLNSFGNSVGLKSGHTAVTSILGARAATAVNLDSTYTLKAGEEVQRANGERGLVYSVTAKDPVTGDYKAEIRQRSASAAGYTKLTKGVWTIRTKTSVKGSTTKVPGVVAKTNEAINGTWTKVKKV